MTITLSVHDLTRGPGQFRSEVLEVAAPADLGVEMASVSENATLKLTLTLTSVSEGVLATGQVSAPVTGECARCLAPISYQSDFELSQLYYYLKADADQDGLFVIDEQIDIEPAIRDAIVLNLPFRPLCKPDCAGLCVQCGTDLNEDPTHHHDEEIDERWAGLQGLFD